MFKFKFASDFLSSKTTFHSLVVIAGAAIAFAHHQLALVPFLGTIAATLHLTFLRDTLAKLGEFDPELDQAPGAPEVPAAPATPVTPTAVN